MLSNPRGRLAVLIVTVPAAFTSLVLAQAPAQASAAHENTNPYTTGCMSGSAAIASKSVSGGTVSIMASPCGTNYVQYSGITQRTTKYGKAAGRNWTTTQIDTAANSFSYQSYAPGSTAYTGVIQIGSTNITATCSTGCTWSTSTAPGTSFDTKVTNFVNATRGRTLANIQGTYPGECVSLVSQFLSQVWGITTGAWGNAIDYRAGGSGGNRLAARGFVWSTSQAFRNGDILVWGPNAAAGTGSAGHIGIWFNGKVYDQNDARHTPARTANSSPFWSGGFLGRWRR